jgi:hypothetical protein
MNAYSVRLFKPSPPEKRRGVSCDANGAFIDDIPLLKRVVASGQEKWMPRDGDDISTDLSKRFGFPIDFSSKTRGVTTIARALNEGSVVRAQLAALFLRFPNPPQIAKSAASKSDLIKFIRELHASDMLKATWEPTEHPRWPGGSDDHQGGRFAPKGEQLESTLADDEVAPPAKTAPANRSKPRLRAWAEVAPKLDPNYQGIPFWMVPVFGEASAGEEIAAEAKGAVEELLSTEA